MMAFFEKIVLLTKKIFTGIYVNLVAAVIIVLIGFIIGKLAGRLVYKILRELEIRSVLKQAGVTAPVERYASAAVAFLIYFIAIIMALNQLKIGTLVLSMIVGAVLFILVVSFILSVKDFMPNLMAGISLYRGGGIRKGDVIETQGVTGRIIQITLSKTKMQTKEGDIVHIPHTAMMKQGFTKKTKKQGGKKGKA